MGGSFWNHSKNWLQCLNDFRLFRRISSKSGSFMFVALMLNYVPRLAILEFEFPCRPSYVLLLPVFPAFDVSGLSKSIGAPGRKILKCQNILRGPYLTTNVGIDVSTNVGISLQMWVLRPMGPWLRVDGLGPKSCSARVSWVRVDRNSDWPTSEEHNLASHQSHLDM